MTVHILKTGFKGFVLTGALLFLASCGTQFKGAKTGLHMDRGATGALDASGYPYTSGADPRVQMAKEALGPRDPFNPTEEELRNLEFAAKLGRPHLTRLGQEGQARSVKSDSFVLLIQMDSQIIKFQGKLENAGDQTWVIENTPATDNPEYSLSGLIEDHEDGTNSSEFYLSFKDSASNNLQARILYRTYLAEVRLRQNKSQDLSGSRKLMTQVKRLEKHARARVKNWVIAYGASFYEVEVLTSKMDIAFAFNGEAKRTSEVMSHPTLALNKGTFAPAHVELFGDAETEDLRSFIVTLKDDRKKITTELILEVEGLAQSHKSLQIESQGLKGLGASAFLQAPIGHSEYPNTSQTLLHFEQHWGLPGVQNWIETFTSTRSQELKSFFRYAKPFTKIIETIFLYSDVPPQVSYLTLTESPYFTGGKYNNTARPPKSTALGPFQFLRGTASDLGMRVYKSSSVYDERRYFVPSACAASQYMDELISDFIVSDATLAILAYHVGPGGSAAAIHCSYGLKNPSDQKACGQRVGGRGFSSQQYATFLNRMKNYRFNFSDISRQKLIPNHRIEYVNKFLAMYFLAGHPEVYGVAPEAYKTQLPKETLMPPKPLQDKECQEAIRPVQSLLYPSA